jgi:hypothetical protein
MTWEELCEKAKEMGAAMWVSGKTFGIFDLLFCEDGDIYVETSYYDKKYGKWINSKKIVVVDRTPDQMYQIMEALR